MKVHIVDLSEWQVPSKINYDIFAKQLSLAIVRVQYGASYQDKYFKTHITELKKRGVPVAVYAWVRGKTIAEMENEAKLFYDRAKVYNPCFWFLDVEEKSMANMRAGVSAYQKKLRSLGAKKVGVYIAHHLYTQFNINTAEFDAVWLPHYGKNDGTQNSKPSYSCDLHQYTSKGRLPGYSGDIDLSVIVSGKPLSFFTGVDSMTEKTQEQKQNSLKARLADDDTYLSVRVRESKVEKAIEEITKLGYACKRLDLA